MDSRKTYGASRIHAAMMEIDLQISRSTVGRFMREVGVKPKRRRRYTKTTISNHQLAISENKPNRDFVYRNQI